MLLALGDVVRVHNDQTLGTVAGFASHSHGNMVCVQVSGGTVRAIQPHDLELVARSFKPVTTGQSLATLLFVVLGLAVAVVNGISVHNLGADLLLTTFVTIASLTTITGGLVNTFQRPRRIRV
ncbi:hypothetical protein LRS74_17325 [Streptomyces sp. LX-29]|uniref:hypothetical protein n=1 Tax=Streptomyces sp. LX-29 TaxID=2900152 RepID=UPI00240E615F|nr:hypothetical protein [Streptomyces sp. LX-29]WFB08613.1 hypothetical protein LRS74_17325 [Streptomyces sp. LX-29]